MPKFTITVNGRLRSIDAEADTPLLWVLRDRLSLFGTKYGCGVGVCGACTVHEDGHAIRSCTRTIAAAAGKRYTTIEGLSATGTDRCQQAWIAEDVAQCGFCQPGMIMETAAMLATTPNPTDEDIDRVLGAHVCRCGTYVRIRRAVHRAARPAGEA